MVGIILDLILLGIILWTAWKGFRTGLIGGVIGIVAVVVAIYGANLVATAYSGEFIGFAEPFVSGIVDTMEARILNYAADTETDAERTFTPKVILEGEDSKNVMKVSVAILRQLGLSEEIADSIAQEVDRSSDEVNTGMNTTLSRKISEKLCFIAVFLIAFMLIVIIFTAIGNVLDVAFGLPGLENLNHILGALFGAAKGLLIVLVLTCIARYLGIILREDIVDKTVIMKKLMENNLVASFLNI